MRNNFPGNEPLLIEGSYYEDAVASFVQNQISTIQAKLAEPTHAAPTQSTAVVLHQLSQEHRQRVFLRREEDRRLSHPQPLFSQQVIRPAMSATDFLTRLHIHPLVRAKAPFLGTTSLLLFGAVRTFAKPMNNS